MWLATTKRGILNSPAGSGKTIIMSAALDTVFKSKPRTMPVQIGWLCHTIEQKQQAQAALEHFPHLLDGAHINVECAAAEHDWSWCDVLVVDECHWGGCDQWSKQVLSCPNARWGMTATPFTEDEERNKFLLSMFDNRVFTVDRSDVSARLAPAVVIMLDSTDAGLQEKIDAEIEKTMRWRRKYWKGEEWELRAAVSWHVCIKRGIIGNKARNHAAIEKAKQHSSDSVIVLVNEIDHGKALAKAIPGAKVCFSAMGKKLRKETLDAFRAGELKCIVATSLADEGIDLPIANVLVLVSGGRSSTKTEQRTGRVLRSFAGKEHGVIYDFLDRQHPMMQHHAYRRLSTYRKLGYNVILP